MEPIKKCLMPSQMCNDLNANEFSESEDNRLKWHIETRFTTDGSQDDRNVIFGLKERPKPEIHNSFEAITKSVIKKGLFSHSLIEMHFSIFHFKFFSFFFEFPLIL